MIKMYKSTKIYVASFAYTYKFMHFKELLESRGEGL